MLLSRQKPSVVVYFMPNPVEKMNLENLETTHPLLGRPTDANAFLDYAHDIVSSRAIDETSAFLNSSLNAFVLSCSQETLNELSSSMRAHRIFEVCMSDPYTKRAYEKPRGYAGDAVMLDYIYSPPTLLLSDIGRKINYITTKGPMGLSILYRRELLRSLINDTIAKKSNARILSVASGHARELEHSYLEKELHSGTFIAIDQDYETCAYLKSRISKPWMDVHRHSFTKLIPQSYDIGNFDLIYSAGLYDYLPQETARTLTSALSRRLTPGGRLLVGNFIPNCYGRGYMELIMDWKLVWRQPEELRSLFDDTLKDQVQVFLDPHCNVAYATLTMN